MSDLVNAWNFIDVNRLETVMTGLLDQSGYTDFRIDTCSFSHINALGQAVFNLTGEDLDADLLVDTRVFVQFAPNGDFVVSF